MLHASAGRPSSPPVKSCNALLAAPEGLAINSSMQLLRLSEVETSSADRVFRYSLTRIALLFLGVICLGIALLLIHWEGRLEPLHYIAYYIFAVLLLGLALLRKFLLARFQPSNWLARMHHTNLLIQFRSYLNYSLAAEDLTVVSIPYQNIRSARLVRERSKIPAQDGTTERTRGLIELELAGDLAPLSEALADEIAKPSPRQKTWYGYTSALYRHYPVRMVSPPFLQVEWSAVPGPKVFLEALRAYTTVAPPVVVSEDFAHIDSLNREEQEMRLRELDQRGETIAAVYLARKLYGYDLTQAEGFIRGLRD